MAQIARNAPCPCGSGKKYKRCCWESDQTVTREEAQMIGGHDRLKVGAILLVVTVACAVGVGLWRDSVRDGLGIGLGLALGSILYLVLRNPPPSKGGDPNPRMNFGQ